MKDTEAPNKPTKETVESAAVEILTQLGGKAHRQQIIPYILDKVPFKGKTPEKSITASLLRATQVRKAGEGYWELVSYQEEIANLKKTIKEKEDEISQLKEIYSPKHCVTLDQVEAEIMECPDWATAKSRIDNINCSGILAETEWEKVWKRIQRAFKQKQEQIRTSQTEALHAVVSRPTTLNNVYPQANSTTNVGCDQKDSEFKTYLPAAGVASAALEHNEEQKRIGI